MSESRIILDLSETTKSIADIDSFIRDLNLMDKHVEVETKNPAISGLVVSLIGNMNRVVIVNGTVVKSFDSNYVIGETVAWLKDFTTIKI